MDLPKVGAFQHTTLPTKVSAIAGLVTVLTFASWVMLSYPCKGQNVSHYYRLFRIPFRTRTSHVPSSSGIVANVECDLYDGSWYYDPEGPLYTNRTCPLILQSQNCQGNGRPDNKYENWRWKPDGCELPRFDPRNFLDLMRGKTIAFAGDSLSRNQLESLLCLLSQVDVPNRNETSEVEEWFFNSTSTKIVRIWSSWLVHKTTEPFGLVPDGVVKLHLDAPDEHFLDRVPEYDVVVLVYGHWFNKPSAYILQNEIVGGRFRWPGNVSRPVKLDKTEAFRISVETIVTAMVTHPGYSGLTVVNSFSPDHYGGRAWNAGGSCDGNVEPIGRGRLVPNPYWTVMRDKQVRGLGRAIGKGTNKSKVRFMDITRAFGYRHDGHPGLYGGADGGKRVLDGRRQDCLHWCLPGPIDVWNEFLLEILTREV